jgi:hypothetical protein
MWSRTSEGKEFAASRPFGRSLHGGKIVLSVKPCPLPSFQRENKTTIISCGGDRKAKIWTSDGDVLQEFPHSAEVDSVCFPGGELMVTGSWDGKFKVWKEGKELRTYTDPEHGHRTSVAWCPDSATLVTTGGKGNIVLYQLADVENGTFTRGRVIRAAHSDFLRGCVPDAKGGGFLTFSNDGTARRFTAAGDTKCTFQVGNQIVYTACVTESGDVVAGGEGKLCKIFGNGESKASQSLPIDQSLISLGALSNGDFITGTGGKASFLRIWSADPSRQLAEEEAKAAEAKASEARGSPAPSSGGNSATGGIPAHMIKPASVLQQPGASDGANVIVMTEGAPYMYQWSETNYQWDLIGAVSTNASGPAPAPAPTPTPSASAFDINVKVDLGTGSMLDLGFNRDSDPYAVAIGFCFQHGIDEQFVPQIMQYIQQLL